MIISAGANITLHLLNFLPKAFSITISDFYLDLIKRNLMASPAGMHLFVQSQTIKTPKQCENLFKVHNKYTRTTSLTSFSCIYCELWTGFTHCFGVYIFGLEQVNSFVPWSQIRKIIRKKNVDEKIELKLFFFERKIILDIKIHSMPINTCTEYCADKFKHTNGFDQRSQGKI